MKQLSQIDLGTLVVKPLPCPFCGILPKVRCGVDNPSRVAVICEADSCRVQPWTPFYGPEGKISGLTRALSVWNTRYHPELVDPDDVRGSPV